MILAACHHHHILIWWSSYYHMMIIISSYSTKHMTYAIFLERRGLKDIKYDTQTFLMHHLSFIHHQCIISASSVHHLCISSPDQTRPDQRIKTQKTQNPHCLLCLVLTFGLTIVGILHLVVCSCLIFSQCRHQHCSHSQCKRQCPPHGFNNLTLT